MAIPIVILRLEGVLQSWGEFAKWEYRDSANLPTKSGIIGIIASAMGIKRGSEKIKQLHASLKIGIRVEKEGAFLRDFHTVIPHSKTDKLMKANNKEEYRTIVSERYYLQHALFMVFIEGDEILLQKVAKAIKNPKWSPFLGRKSCIPTKPIFKEYNTQFKTLEEALRNYPLENPNEEKSLYLCEMDGFQGEYTRKDNPSKLLTREYTERKVKRFSVEL